MKRTMYEKLSSYAKPTLWGGALLGLLFAVGATAIGDMTPEGKRLRQQNRNAFGLFSGPTAVLRGNLLQCGIDNQGNVCTDVFNSPTGGGGFWPAGSVDAYIFNTGLQIAGINDDAAGPWSNDTVAAYFFDARGTQQHSAPLTDVFDTQVQADADELRRQGIFIDDPDLFAPSLLPDPTADPPRPPRVNASQQDSWTQYWDGDPNRIANRKHPMGIKVTQRSMSWNFPTGNESIIYFIYDFENVTNDGEFQRLNELQFFAGDNALPDAGWQINDLYASFSTDMDVTSNATQNFSTAILSFDMGISYHGGFLDQTFVYPPNLFKPPFFLNSPGIVGVKYLKSPVNPATGNEVGLTLFSNTQNPSSAGAQFVDPLGDEQLWRYLSGNLVPALGDPPCNVEATTPNDRPVCFVFQQAADTRFYQASGPFSVAAGDEATIVVAYMVAATVQTMPDGSPSGILANQSSANANPPGVPSFHPGFASARGCDSFGLNCTVTLTALGNAVLPIERGSGWFQFTGFPPMSDLELSENKLDQFEVDVVPESLLGKALVAQTIFDNKFLLGFSPDPPPFFLVEGDNNVTIIWNKSPSQDAGDPFFSVANDSTSALFNPNYRQFDVEGYRVFRGTTPDNIVQIAQFDFDGTFLLDVICETVLPADSVGVVIDLDGDGMATDVVNGFAGGETCPLVADSTAVQRNIGRDLIFNNAGAGGAPGNGVVRLLTGAAEATQLDTALADQPVLLQDNGVPFVFVDETAQNNFTYFYSVSAFDINSQASGPISLESARTTKGTVPRANAPNLVEAEFITGIAGDDGLPLDLNALMPSIDGETGIFSGSFPPSDGFVTTFQPLLLRLLPEFTRAATIDSFVVKASGNALGSQEDPSATCPEIAGTGGRGSSPFGACWDVYLSVDVDGAISPFVVSGYNPWWGAFGEPPAIGPLTFLAAEVPFDQDALDAFGVPSGSGNATVLAETQEALNVAEGPQNRRAGSSSVVSRLRHGGSRWFDGDTEAGTNNTVADPARYMRVGSLAGIDTVWSPIAYTPLTPGGAAPGGDIAFEKQCFDRGLAFLKRAADVRFTWQDGTFGEVRDITHQADVRFSEKIGPNWGFLNTDSNGNGVLDWQDFNYIDRGLQIVSQVDGGGCDAVTGGSWNADSSAVPVDLASSPVMMPTSTNGMDVAGTAGLAQTGTGFGLYVNGERYIFETSTLPSNGTTWTLRSYSGGVRSGSDSFDSDDPSGYTYVRSATTRSSGTRPIYVEGITFVFEVEEPTQLLGKPDLSAVHTVPNPYLANSRFDLAPTEKQMMFVNMPAKCTLRIYSLTGVLIRSMNYSDATGGGRLVWDMRNRDNQFIASGVYFFVVVTPEGDEHVGKFTVINFAGQN